MKPRTEMTEGTGTEMTEGTDFTQSSGATEKISSSLFTFVASFLCAESVISVTVSVSRCLAVVSVLFVPIPSLLTVSAHAQTPQVPRHLARAVPWHLKEGFIDETHEYEVLGALAPRLPVERGP